MNPLELQELLYRVGWFVPLWVPRACNSTDLDFCPSDLVACTKVNRLWRTTLTPILWRVYDWYRNARVPLADLVLNVQHLRYVHLATPWDPDTLPTRLQVLCLYSEAVASMRLLYANPQLAQLAWNSGCCRDHDPNIQVALESLSRLQVFDLKYYHFSAPEQLNRILANNLHLRQLTLYHIEGITNAFDYAPLENLTCLRLQVDWLRNPALAHLLRSCSSLEVLEYEAAIACPTFPLAHNLRECCPRLHTLCRIDYRLYDPGNLQEDLCELEVVALIQAVALGRMRVLEMSVLTLTDRICHVLVARHGQVLERIKLRCQRVNEANVRNVGRLLRACPRLVALDVSHVASWGAVQGFPPRDSLRLLDEGGPWGCENTLQEIRMLGFTPECTMVEGATDTREPIPRILGLPERHLDEDKGILDLIVRHGWVCKAVPAVSMDIEVNLDSIPADLRFLRNVVFDHVVRWPQIRRVEVENLEYERETKRLCALAQA
ncbi:hypothetical protein BG000_004871 [Podila horticola]|nr:hypothetical protein BG000_004871 [Podila horticola]